MALINCPECQKEISDLATMCPNCGVAITPQNVYEKKVHVASLVLSIIGLVFSILFPLVTYPCSIVGLVMAVKKRPTNKTTAAFVMCIIGLVIALINSAIGAYMGANGLLF